MSGLDCGMCGLESEVSRIELGGGGSERVRRRGVWVNNFTAASPPPPHSSQVICPLWWGRRGEGGRDQKPGTMASIQHLPGGAGI